MLAVTIVKDCYTVRPKKWEFGDRTVLVDYVRNGPFGIACNYPSSADSHQTHIGSRRAE